MTNSETQDDEMECGLNIAEQDSLQRQLRALPDTTPPRAVWQRIELQAKAEGLFSGRQQLERMKWLAGTVIAATVAMLVLDIPLLNSPVIDDDDGATTVPAEVPTNSVNDLNALKVQSQILERNLRLLPEQPRVMKVSTATTIQELEDQITVIDYVLNDRTVSLDSEQEEIYWRERVRLMNSLVNLRYAQTQRISF